jgi:hypothetical protein
LVARSGVVGVAVGGRWFASDWENSLEWKGSRMGIMKITSVSLERETVGNLDRLFFGKC